MSKVQSPSHHMPGVHFHALAFLVSAVTAGASITTEGRCNFTVFDLKFRHTRTQKGKKSRVNNVLIMQLFGSKATATRHDFAVAEISAPLIGSGKGKALILFLKMFLQAPLHHHLLFLFVCAVILTTVMHCDS